MVENPAFDSQTKEALTSQAKNFGSLVRMSQEAIDKVLECGIVDNILAWARARQQAGMAKRLKVTSKSRRSLGIPELEDANWAGGEKRPCRA